MTEELLKMSHKEIDRLRVIEQVIHKQISQVAASRLLGITTRWVRQLQSQYQRMGAAGLVSKRRGKPSNHRLPQATRQRIAALIQAHYPDFKPTLAHEKLLAHHGVSCSRETVRQIMMTSGLWQGKGRQHVKRLYQQRTRRPCFGELVQIDGSPHDWFEGRAPECCLLVFVDDATSKLVALHFAEVECTQAYFEAVEQHLKRYGRPLAYYSDRHSIFRVNIKEAQTGSGLTQLGRACQTLGIELICANSPQAKGRVERANKTLQDRLVKEMRLDNINSLEQANDWLPGFVNDYNQRFAVEPHDQTDAHRTSLPSEEHLQRILSQQSTRILSKQLELSYQNQLFQIQTKTPAYSMRKAKVTVCDHHGHITLLYKGQALPYKRLNKHNPPALVGGRKQINALLNSPHQKRQKPHKPNKNHPWKQHWKKVG